LAAEEEFLLPRHFETMHQSPRLRTLNDLGAAALAASFQRMARALRVVGRAVVFLAQP
jgi:hypothetical protein